MCQCHLTCGYVGHAVQRLECSSSNCGEGLAYIGSKAEITHTALDQSGNAGTCTYSVTVRGKYKKTQIRNFCLGLSDAFFTFEGFIHATAGWDR